MVCRVEWKGKKKKKKDKQPDKQDLYGLLGLNAERWTATEAEIKLGTQMSCAWHLDKTAQACCDPDCHRHISLGFGHAIRATDIRASEQRRWLCIGCHVCQVC